MKYTSTVSSKLLLEAGMSIYDVQHSRDERVVHPTDVLQGRLVKIGGQFTF